MRQTIDQRADLTLRKHGRISRLGFIAGRRLFDIRRAAAVPAFLALTLASPLQAQNASRGSVGVVAMIPADARIGAQAAPAQGQSPELGGVAPASGFCDASPSDCLAARQALAQGISSRASKVAQNQPARPDGAAEAAFGGLASAATAKADANSLRFGLIAPFSGANKGFAGELKLGAETAFAVANDAGGVNGKTLRIIADDDGYDPARTPDVARKLAEKDKVFGFLSDFGSATSASILPYALEHKLVFFGAFSGSGALRRSPPDRYVFNYRPSYAEETEAVVNYLVKVRRLKPSQIAVFAQDDAFGDAGYAGVEKAMRALDENAAGSILRLKYARNSIDVAAAIEDLRKHRELVTTTVTRVRERVASVKPVSDADGLAPAAPPHRRYREKTVRRVMREPGIKAVVMVATYRAAAKFIEKTRDQDSDMIYTNVSAVGSNDFAEELKLLGPRYTNGVIVTQVVPDPQGYSSIALEYKTALAKYFPAEHPDYVSFESYINAKIMLDGLKKAGPQPDSDKLVNALESIHGLDLGLGSTIGYSPSEHQAIHKVWGTQLDDQGHYHFIDLE